MFNDLFTGVIKTQRLYRTREDLADFDSSEHGIGLKLSALRLADTCLILSKFKQKGQVGI